MTEALQYADINVKQKGAKLLSKERDVNFKAKTMSRTEGQMRTRLFTLTSFCACRENSQDGFC